MYNNDSDSLNAGAPDIRLSGNQQMASAPDPTAEMNDFSMQVFGKPLHQLTPPQLDALYELMNEQSKAPQQDSGIMAAGPGTYTQNRKQMMAYGGIAGADGRKKYGIGSFFQKYVKDPLEVAFTGKTFADLEEESQARVDEEDRLYGEGYQNPFDTFLKGAPAAKADDLVNQYLGTGNEYDMLNMFGLGANDTSGEDPGKLPFGLSNFGLGNISLNPYLKYKQTIRDPYKPQIPHPGYGGGMDREEQERVDREHAARQAAVAVVPGEYKQTERVNPLYPIAAGLGVGKYVSGLPKDKLPMDTTSMDPAAIATAARGTDAQGAAAGLRFLPEQVTRAAQGGRIGYNIGGITGEQNAMVMDMLNKGMDNDAISTITGVTPEDIQIIINQINEAQKGIEGSGALENLKAQGGRIGADEGGLMNLGGMEKDYRNDGGFVPIGGKEKADDVPARLSKNEFVFTADAVRGAGGGDIDKGAEIMENLMKSLESGGENLEGARGMFANAQQLQKRII